jgi:hypothetical protein
MQEFTASALEKWEDEGGATRQAGSDTAAPVALTGTANQIEWAEQIKERVGREFDRVADAMKSVAARQVDRDRTDTDAVVAILEEKRFEVMAKDRAGYFITDWQELDGQVRQMVVEDPRYGQIKTNRAARKRTSKITPD